MARRTLESGYRPSNRRRGLSLLEFIGCLIAVVGGMWLGAIYLGVDAEGLLFSALDEAELLDKVPERLRPDVPDGHPSQMTEEEFSTALQSELVALRQEIVALRETTHGKVGEGRNATDNGDPDQPTRKQTLAYWNRLRNIVQDEAALQANARAAWNEANADSTFALRGRVSQFAAKTVEAIPTERVDREAVKLGQQLVDWYRESGAHNQRAAQLWSDRNAQKSAAQLTRAWETADRQLRNEAELLVNKAASVRASLSRRYKSEFPPFNG